MLTILTGRAKSGKSERILREIKALRDSGKQILIVPQYATHEAEIDLCTVCGDAAARHAEVLSFESLAQRVLKMTCGSGDEVLDAGGKLLTMQRTVQEIAPELRVLRRSFLKAAYLTNLISLADEFRSYQVTPEQLTERADAIGGATGDKLRDLALIVGVYEAKLTHDLTDARDRVTRLAEQLEDSGYVRDKDIFFDGISYFNAREEQILRIMLRQGRSVTVTLLYDPNDHSGLFDDTAETIARLRLLAGDCGAEVRTEHCESGEAADALSFLEQHFFGPAAVYDGDASAVRVHEAVRSSSEAEHVAAEIRRLTARGYRYRDIGIVCRNLSEMQDTLSTVLRRYGIPFYLSRRSDILEKPVISLIVGALDAIGGGYEYEDMFRWLKTGLAGLSDGECDLLENYVIRWDIRGSMWLRPAEWNAHPEGYGAEWTEESRAALSALNALRERIRLPLLRLSEGLKNGTPAREMVRSLYAFLQALDIPRQMESRAAALQEGGEYQKAEEYTQLWNILCGVMDQFVDILGETALDGDQFARLFRLILTQYRVGTIPVSYDQVKIGSMDRNDRQTVRCLFLMGANDHVIPAVEGGGGLLTDEERELLSEGGIRLAPGADARFALELQNLYAALAQPTEQLTVSYPVSDITGSALRPSFVVERLKRMFPGLCVAREDRSAEDACAAVTPALAAAGERIDGPLWNYFAEKPAYAAPLSAMRRAAKTQRGKLSGGAVELLYGRSLHMSASRLDRARQCHYAYFLQYGLKAKERRQSAFDAPEIGTFLHDVLEHVAREAQRRGGFAAVENEELRALTYAAVDRYAAEALDHLRDQNARFRYLFNRLRQSVLRIVEDLAEELRESDFIPLAFELEFGAHGQIPAVTIEEAGRTLSLTGKVDRVDGWLHEGKLYLRVVDYKTGKKSFDLSEVRYGLNLQMLLYLFTLREKGADYFQKPVEAAGVLYMPAREPLLRAERGVDAETLQKQMEKELRRSGLVLSHPAVLKAMEHSALEEPRYLPIRVNRKGEISGGIADAEKLGLLAKHVDRQLRQITRELGEGVIDADPCGHSAADAACQYCAFKTACHFEDGRGSDHMRYIRPVADLAELCAELRGQEKEGAAEHE